MTIPEVILTIMFVYALSFWWALDAPDEMMKRIRILCHPDKHQGSQMSHKVFMWLESQR